MYGDDQDTEPSAGILSRVFKVVLLLLIVSLIPLAFYLCAGLLSETGYSPFGLFGEPVFVKTTAGERAVILTGQWRLIRPPGRFSEGYDYNEFYVDLWAIDAVTAEPLWRKRIEKERGGGMIDRSLLGVDGSVVWLLLHGKLVGVSVLDGSVLVPAGKVEAANVELKGLMPTDSRYFIFDRRGLCITGADARRWRIDPDSLKVTPLETESQPAKDGGVPPEFTTPGSSGLHLVRGLDMTTSWLGLLTDDEAGVFEETDRAADLTPETRRRLWGARAQETKGEMGKLRDYSELKPLPEAPEFLDGGLLREYSKARQLPALWVTDPDSVFVLHREKLGIAGKLHLTRITGPAGRPAWEAALPLTVVQSVKKMDKTILILGKEYIEGDPEISDALRDSPGRLVAVELTSGVVHTHSLSPLETHPQAEEIDTGI